MSAGALEVALVAGSVATLMLGLASRNLDETHQERINRNRSPRSIEASIVGTTTGIEGRRMPSSSSAEIKPSVWLAFLASANLGLLLFAIEFG